MDSDQATFSCGFNSGLRPPQTTFSLAVNLNFKLPLTLGLCSVKEILTELPLCAIPGWEWGFSSERGLTMGRKGGLFTI